MPPHLGMLLLTLGIECAELYSAKVQGGGEVHALCEDGSKGVFLPQLKRFRGLKIAVVGCWHHDMELR